MKDSGYVRARAFILGGLVLWVGYILSVLARFPGSLQGTIVRAAALLGYTALFLTIVSSEYVRTMRKLFGRPYLRIHHALALAGLVLIVVHPLTFAVRSGTLSVFVPVFTPLSSFLTWASRPALYLIVIAVLAAMARRRLKDAWRVVHWLNYLAFAMVFTHASMLGSDLALAPIRVVITAMALIVVAVLVHKRFLGR